MKRKIYFKTSTSSLIIQAILIASLLLDIFLAIFFNISYLTTNFRSDSERQFAIILSVIFYVGILPLLYFELTFLLGNIILGKEKIYTHGDFKIGPRTQFHTEMKYEDIKKVSVMAFRRDSRGKYKQALKPLPYILVESKNGRQVLFSLRYMSVKMVKRLLDELSNRCSGPAINVHQLVKEFRNYNKIYK